jgi:hypothetical protein
MDHQGVALVISHHSRSSYDTLLADMEKIGNEMTQSVLLLTVRARGYILYSPLNANR